MDVGDEIMLLSRDRRTGKVGGCAWSLRLPMRVCVCVTGVFVYHLLCGDLSHSPPTPFPKKSRRSDQPAFSKWLQHNDRKPSRSRHKILVEAAMTSSNRQKGAFGVICVRVCMF